MQVSVTGRNMDVGQALHSHVAQQVPAVVHKYFDRATSASITFSREAYFFRCDMAVHADRGVDVRGTGQGPDAYTAFEGALDRVGKQLRRYKERLREHVKGGDTVPARQYVVEGPAAEAGEAEPPETAESAAEAAYPEGDNPVVIAETPGEIPVCTVQNAVMRLDLSDEPAVMFRNAGNERLNVVYRRPDGNIGWIDPQVPAGR